MPLHHQPSQIPLEDRLPTFAGVTNFDAAALSVSSRQVAHTIHGRHDHVKRSIERLAKRGVIGEPELVEGLSKLGRPTAEYRISEDDSFIVTAKLEGTLGLLPAVASAVMNHLRAGGTFADAPVSYKVSRAHGRKHPEWWAEAYRTAIANSKRRNREAIDRRVAKLTHCKRGHALSGSNIILVFRDDGVRRSCRACKFITSRAVRPLTTDEVERAKSLLQAGVGISKLYGAKGFYVANRASINHRCSIDPVFDKIVAAAKSRLIALPDPHAHDNSAFLSACGSADFEQIRRLVPSYLPSHERDDIAQDVMVALLEGRITRAGIPAHLRKFMTIHNRMFPPGFAKIGKARVVSLDEPLIDGGKATRSDFVSEGLWA